MKKWLKISLFFLLFVVLTAYFLFLYLVPRIDISPYVDILKKTVKETTDLNLDIGNVKIYTTPYLSAGIEATDIVVSLPDNSTVAAVPYLKGGISLPQLLLLNVKVDKLLVYKPVVDIEIVNKNEFKFVKTIEKVLSDIEKNKSEDTVVVETEAPPILNWIRINVPNIDIRYYRFYIADLASKDYLLFEGDRAKIGYFNGKSVKVKTEGGLYLNKDKHVSVNLALDTYIPEKGELDEEDDPEARMEVQLVNPVDIYKKYGLKGDIEGKIKLRENKMSGFLNLENLTLKVGNCQIPKSYFKTKLSGKNFFIDTSLAIKENQKLNVNGKVKLSKYPHFNLNIFSNGVYFNDLIVLSKELLDSLGIKNNLAQIEGRGYFIADATIKTNSRKFDSNGSIKVKNGAIINKNANLSISDVNLDVLFDNCLKISDGSLKINDGLIKLSAFIDKDTNTDVSLSASKIPVPALYRGFAPQEIKNQINITSGDVSTKATVKGKLKKFVSDFDVSLDNFILTDKLQTLILSNKKFDISGNYDKKLSVKVKNQGFQVSQPYIKASVKDDLIEVSYLDDNLELKPTQFRLNSNSVLTAKGSILDCSISPEIDFKFDGNFYANELKTLLGPSAAPFIDSKGVISFIGNFAGNERKQTARVQIASNSNNYITPVHIKRILNGQSIIQFLADFKGNRIKIKNSGLYSRTYSKDLTEDYDLNLSGMDEIIKLTGTIANLDRANPSINLLKLTSKPLSFSLAGFPNSNIDLNTNINVFGNLNSPRTKGHIIAKNIVIPDLKLNANQMSATMNGKQAKLATDGLILNESDLKLTSDLDLSKIPLIWLRNLKITSNNLDADKLMVVSNNLLSMIPADPTPKAPADIPAVIASGNFDIKNLKSGNIEPKNTKGDIKLYKNVLSINNLQTDVFKGKVNGKADINILDYNMAVKVRGESMDVDEALVVLANMKDTLSGELSFDTDIKLQGLEYEQQVKSLDGVFNFKIKDGQAGPFSKVENIFLSENLRESTFFNSAFGSVITSAVSVDTSRFKELLGTIYFNKTGIAKIDPITMQGNALCLKIGGEMDILGNTLDAHVRGRLGSMVESMLGPLTNLNPVNIVKATPGLNVVMAKTFSFFCEAISEEEMNRIPSFSKKKSDLSATKFQLILRGDVNKPLGLLKSFKWLVTEEEYAQAEQFVASIPENMPEGVSTLEELKAYQEQLAKEEAESKTFFGKIKKFFKKFIKKKSKEKV